MTGPVRSGMPWGSVAIRAVAFAALWCALAGTDAADLPAAVVAVIAATWASLRLSPPGDTRFSAVALLRLAARFPVQALTAGTDVALRSLRPTVALQPGFVAFPARLPPGRARMAFTTLTSLLPGTLPLGEDAAAAERFHCLDTAQPVLAQLAEEERLFRAAIGHRSADA